MAPTDESPAAEGAPPRRRQVRYRRRLRSRIILSYLLLGFGLTLALAFSTNSARSRVENQMVEDVMNRNIDEGARRFCAIPGCKPEVAFQQMRAYAFAPDSDRLQRDFPEWGKLEDGIYGMVGQNLDGSPFSYKLAVRKTPD